MSAFSCISVLPSEELDKLLEDVRSLGDDNLQVWELRAKSMHATSLSRLSC